MKQALEMSEQNFVTKFNHAPHLSWGLYYMSMSNGLSQPSPREQYRPSLKRDLLFNLRKLFTNQSLERSEQNIVTKLNHAPHPSWGLYYMSMPNGLPQAWSQGAL